MISCSRRRGLGRSVLVLLLLVLQRGVPNECGDASYGTGAATAVVVTEAAVTVAAAAGTIAVSSVVVVTPQHPA